MTQQAPLRRVRARELGIILGIMSPGPLNAITDVAGTRVGYIMLLRRSGPLVRGVGPVRTGVTAILPHRDNLFTSKVPVTATVFNGFCRTLNDKVPPVRRVEPVNVARAQSPYRAESRT